MSIPDPLQRRYQTFDITPCNVLRGPASSAHSSLGIARNTRHKRQMSLPIDPILPELAALLRAGPNVVLQAPPGAGKTTRVPLYLLSDGLFDGRIVMLEPRRLAARAAAERMAETLGEPVGQTVGYTMRGARKSGPQTRIEVMTEGVLTRMLQTDPELSGISAILFDEFHERSLQSDLGLALALEVQATLRDDLRLLAMSATLDAAPVAKLMGDAPVLTAQGRSFDVEARYLATPLKPPAQGGPRFEAAMADLICQAATEAEGAILAFLPGEAEIRRTAGLLSPRLPDCAILPLYGALPAADQRAALDRSAQRKVVLATSIAETSLTIPDIRIVVDGGHARRARFDAGSGMSRLVTERVSKAEATQRQGRAGRVARGVCYKLWPKGAEGGFAPFAPPEILSADLAPLALDLALWGTGPQDLALLDPPREGDFAAARDLLRDLDALDAEGRITDHGRTMAAMPLHPRLAHMLLRTGSAGRDLAALLDNRDILGRGRVDMDLRLAGLRDADALEARVPVKVNRATRAQVRADAKRLRIDTKEADLSPAQMLALAYPDRIGLRRDGDAPRYLLSGGKGAVIEPDDPLATARLIVANDLDGDAREAKVRQAIAISKADLHELFADKIKTTPLCRWSKRHRRVEARLQERLGALVLSDHIWKDCPADQKTRAMVDGIRNLGISALPWTRSARLMQARIQWARAQDSGLPDCSDAGLLERLEDWVLPHLSGVNSAADLARLNMDTISAGWLEWDQAQRLNQLAPASLKAPTGTGMKIDYAGDTPKVSVRLQELFGLTQHPMLGTQPLLIELLSPAQRPVQLTTDLPGFWATSYADVRKDLRGRYPKHPWPEDPTTVAPTRRAKPRKG